MPMINASDAKITASCNVVTYNELIDNIVKFVKSGSSVILATHVVPDPDAIGSSFALARVMCQLGVECSVYVEEGVPQRLSSLVADTPVITKLPSCKCDLLIVTDTASKKRVGGGEALVALADCVINIDHHHSNEIWANLNYIDADAAASSIIVWGLVKFLCDSFGLSLIDPVIANLLYAGLLDDTGSFHFSNSDSNAFIVGSELVTAGADPVQVANALFYTIPFRALKLKAMALSGLCLVLDNKVSIIEVDRNMMQSCGACVDDAEGLVDEARSVDGVVVAMLIRERDDGWKVSLRAKNKDIDVSQIAKQFGGGGHKGAAGCTINASKDVVIDRLLSALSVVVV